MGWNGLELNEIGLGRRENTRIERNFVFGHVRHHEISDDAERFSQDEEEEHHCAQPIRRSREVNLIHIQLHLPCSPLLLLDQLFVAYRKPHSKRARKRRIQKDNKNQYVGDDEEEQSGEREENGRREREMQDTRK